MKNKQLKQFRSAINIRELSEMLIGYDSTFVSPMPNLNQFYTITVTTTAMSLGCKNPTAKDVRVPLGNVLTPINIFLDYAGPAEMRARLTGKRNQSFYVDLIYEETPERRFEAHLPSSFKLDFPANYRRFSYWQQKLRELLAKTKV